ncbi:MAG: SAM-dependent methyltransferase [Pseudomonadota bacterium]
MNLTDYLIRRIRATGPLTIADWMTECLLHPTLGYYTTRDPLGTDFTTAPEISQMFGEMLGLCLAQAWMDQGQPQAVLADLGPGRGTLMADLLRATKGVPGFHDALSVHLVEASPVLRDRQAETLAGRQVTWHDRVEDLPDGPLFLVANEFLDALPIRQWVRDREAWRERLVTEAHGALAFALGPPVPVPELDEREDVPDGTLVERCPALSGLVGSVAAHVAQGGAAIFIDYGHWRSQGDTLQAVRGGEKTDPLALPGQTDLTAHVDFEAIARAAGPTTPSAMATQGVLLERLGITARAHALAAGMTGAALESHITAHRRLTHPAEMGDLFKAMALAPPATPLPPGFDPLPPEAMT